MNIIATDLGKFNSMFGFYDSLRSMPKRMTS